MDRKISIALQTDKSPVEYIQLAKLINQFDFDTLSVYCDLPYHPSFGPLLLMAPHMQRARLGAAAISPFRIHPMDIAAETALLAAIAEGGVYIGLARGAWLKEHGINEADQPIQGLREAIFIIRQLLSGESAGYQGRVFQVANHVRAPYPLPKQKVPILIGTWGSKLASLAGEIADEVKVGGSTNPNLIPIMRGYIRSGELRANRPDGSVKLVMGAVCVVDEDREQAIKAAKRAAALYLPVIAPLDPIFQIDSELLVRIKSIVEMNQMASAANLISDEILLHFGFAGTPNDLINQAERLFEAGADRIEFGTPHGLDTSEGIRLIGKKVLPALKF
jgi:5,10-methylenetetrahydromethanopterin reductase